MTNPITQPDMGEAGKPDIVDDFEAWWATSPKRHRHLIGYSDKKLLAFEAFSAGRTPVKE